MSYYFNETLNLSFDKAIAGVTEELKKKGFGILTDIDVKANAVRELVQGAFEKALAILRAQREMLVRGARELLAKETLGEEDLRRLRSPAAENIAAATAVERRPA